MNLNRLVKIIQISLPMYTFIWSRMGSCLLWNTGVAWKIIFLPYFQNIFSFEKVSYDILCKYYSLDSSGQLTFFFCCSIWHSICSIFQLKSILGEGVETFLEKNLCWGGVKFLLLPCPPRCLMEQPSLINALCIMCKIAWLF